MRCSKSAAQPSVTALSPRRRSSTGEARGGVGEVLGVAGLVEERAPVVEAAHRLDHEHHLAGDLDRRAEGARRLQLAVLEVEVDVRLRAEVDPEPGQRRLERGQHLVGGEAGVPRGRAEHPRDVPALRLRETDPDGPCGTPVGGRLEQLLGVGEQRAALRSERVELEAEAPVEVEVVVGAEGAHSLLRARDALEVDRGEVLLGRLVPRELEPLALGAVGLVRDPGPQVAEADRLAVHL